MCNLISVAQLDEEDHNMTLGGGAWKVTKGTMIVAQGYKSRTLYISSNCRDMATVADFSC